MIGARHIVAAPDLPEEPRHALVVATTAYHDPALRRLRAPTRDATDLATILADSDIGGFDVTSVVDRTAQEIRIALESFLADRRPADLALIYLSCHGLVDARRRLYFAGADTSKVRLAATGVESRWLLEQIEDCRARRQVLILDCCFSGAFALNAKGENDLDLGNRFGGHSRGRVVLTASRATEYSFEGEPLAGTASGSVFTSALIEGIRTGGADVNNDGFVGVEEAYEYAFQQVRAARASQTPQRHVFGAEGASIVLARSPAGMTIGAADLPQALQDALDNPFVEVRIGGANALAEWLRSPNPSKVLAARQALHRLVDSDTARVAEVAHGLLEAQAQPDRRARKPAGAAAFPPASPLRQESIASNPEQTAEPEVETSQPGSTDPNGQATSPKVELPLEEFGYQMRGLAYGPRVVPKDDEPSLLVMRYLFPTEKFRGEWRRHPIVIVKQSIYAAIAIMIALTQPGIQYLPPDIDVATVRPVTQVGLGVVAVHLLWRNVTWYFERFVLTNKRIMLITGLLRRHVSMMPLQRVTDMKYDQTPIARLLNYGTFILESAGRLDRLRRIRNLPNPSELYLRVVEELYEPEAVEARLAYADSEGDRTWNDRELFGVAHVKSISEPPSDGAIGEAEMELSLSAAGMDGVTVKIRDPNVPVSKWPEPGAILPVEIPVSDVGQTRVIWTRVLTHAQVELSDDTNSKRAS
jgi:uncharacterized caspase-like protein